jgi:hypothetical protein
LFSFFFFLSVSLGADASILSAPAINFSSTNLFSWGGGG